MHRPTRSIRRLLLAPLLLLALAPACAATPKETAQLLTRSAEEAPASASPPAPAPAPAPAPGLGAAPPLDGDGDAIDDADDRCPLEPETRNGYEDEDGCPDAIPEQVATFTGVMRGVNFGSAAAGGGARATRASAPERQAPSVQGGPRAVASGERYAHAAERGRIAVADDPRSTFSVDVDTASYSNVRRFLREGFLPPVDAVRIEEMLNYFRYAYPPPAGDEALAVHAEVAPCPWDHGRRLVQIGLSTRTLPPGKVPPRNLVFLIDVSGSMTSPDKLPLVKASLERLVSALGPRDRIALVVYAGAAGVVLPPTPGDRKAEIRAAIGRLEAGGSTAGGAGIELAYALARENFDPKGQSRVILATDGDFNIGPTSDGALVRLIEEKRRSGVHLTVLGFGAGNLNDAMMEQLADHGDGHYAYIDSVAEAERALIRGAQAATLTAAKDVKIQVEWNPLQVAEYRLLGYDNRALEDHEFRDDRKDAGDMGPGHQVTALYEIKLRGRGAAVEARVPASRYQEPAAPSAAARGDELLTIGVRYKSPDGARVRELSVPLRGPGAPTLAAASDDLRFAAAVAEFGAVLRGAPAQGSAGARRAAELARGAIGDDPHGERAELVALIESWSQARDEAARREERARAQAREDAIAEEAARREVLRAERLALREERAARRRTPAQALAQASLLTAAAKRTLAHSAQLLKEYPSIRLEISGHSDSHEGRSDADRLAFSRARAEAVRDFFVRELGVDPSRLEIRAAGDAEPIDTNKTALGRARNRRVEFTVLVQ